jgi:SAM-dependent methyltransferase
MERRSLDLGCGANLRGPEGCERWGIDVIAGLDQNTIAADLAFEPIPFPDAHFERVCAYDFLEHLPMRAWVMDANGKGRTINVMVNLFNEVYRVLAPGGVFETFTPHGPHWQEVFRDPTHVSFWVEQTWEYFAHPGTMVGLTRHYGLTADFHIARKEWRGAHLYVELRKA